MIIDFLTDPAMTFMFPVVGIGIGAGLLIASLVLGATQFVSSFLLKPPEPPTIPGIDPNAVLEDEEAAREAAAEKERKRLAAASRDQERRNVRSFGQLFSQGGPRRGKLLGV